MIGARLAGLRDRSIVEVASLLGLHPGRSASLSPCPACGAEVRGQDDKRGPIGTRRDGRGWRCHRCDVGGDAVDLAGWVRFGGRLGAGDPRWPELLRNLASLGLVGPGGAPARAAPSRSSPPPETEVAELWDCCRLAGDDPAVAAWLERRGLDVSLVEDRDLARAVPAGGALPRWARCCGRSWAEGWRCMVPTWGAAGALVGLRGRWVLPDDPPRCVKAAAPRGGAVGVLAGPLGRLLLARGVAPGWWPAGRPLVVVVAEGEVDLLAWATCFGEADEAAPAVLGVVAGAWTPEIAARVPDGAEVVIATDHDKAGDEYARQIAASLGPRCGLRRWRVPDA